MPVAKTLIVLWLVAVAALMAATVPAPTDASPDQGTLQFSLHSEPSTYPYFAGTPRWILTLEVVDTRAIQTPIRDVKVQLSVDPPELAIPGGWTVERIRPPSTTDTRPDHDGHLDRVTGVWTIPDIPPGGRKFFLRIDGRDILNRDGLGGGEQWVIARLHAEILPSRPMEHPPTPMDNETEVHYIISPVSRSINFTVADPAVYLRFASKADDEAVISIMAANDGATKVHPGLPRPNSHYINHAFDVSVEYELTEGLEFAPGPLPPDVEQIDDRTRRLNVGTIFGTETTNVEDFPELDVPVVISTFPSVRDLPLSERCLTAKVVQHYSPAFKLDLIKRRNDVATLCLEDTKQVLSSGEVILWWLHDCVGVTEYPCNNADELLLLAREDGYNNIKLPEDITSLKHIYSVDRYLAPDSIIINIRDPAGRQYDGNSNSVTDGTTVSWQTGRKDSGQLNQDGIKVWFARAGFNDNLASWQNLLLTASVSGPPGTTAPVQDRVKVRFDTSTGTTFFDLSPPNLMQNRGPFTFSGNPFTSHTSMFLEFETLGTYVVNFHVLATRSDGVTTYSASGDYIFHVGPVAELAVWDGGASPLAPPGRTAYTIHASNNGPGTASAALVTLTNVPEGAEVITLDGTYRETSCVGGVCEVEWDLGRLSVSDTRPDRGQTEYPTLTLIAPAGVPAPNITASIANTQDYSVVIDGATHTTPHFDYIDENNTATIMALPGTGEGAQGTPPAPSVLTFPNQPLAIVRWAQVERLNGWPVSRYEVRAFAPPCQRPTIDAAATATVAGELYLDETLSAGEERCYAVRAVNERGGKGYWSPVKSTHAGVSLRSVTVEPQALTVAENGGEASYSVALGAQPTAPVTLTATVADDGVAKVHTGDGMPGKTAVLTFTTSDWSQAQRVTVTGVDDTEDNPQDRRGTTILNSVRGGGYDFLPMTPVVVTVTDDDGPAEEPEQRSASVSRNSLVLAEDGGRDTYTVSLSHAPTAQVVLTITAEGPVTVSPARAIFAIGDKGPKTVTVTAVDDGEVNDNGQRSADISHTLRGVGWDDVEVPGLSVTVLDDDDNVPASVSKSADSLTMSESGGTGAYSVSLSKRPTGLVTVSMSVGGDDPESVQVAPPSLVFTPEDWKMPQTVTVLGVDDQAVTGTREATINHAVFGGGYSGATLGPVSVTVSDDDVAGIKLSKTALTVSETAGQREETYEVTLSGQPTAEVTVTIVSSDEEVARVDNGQVTFRPDDWNVPHVITVTAQDDYVVNAGDPRTRTATITHTASGGYGFDGLTEELEVTVTDDDEVGIEVITDAGDRTLYVKDGGRSNSYVVKLGSQPEHDVVITVTNPNPGAFTVDAEVTIAPDDWAEGRRVTVTSQSGAASDATAVITHTATSQDGDYNGLPVKDMTVKILPPPTVSVTAVSDKIAGGQSAQFELRSDRVLREDLTVEVFAGTNFQVLDEGEIKTVTISEGADRQTFWFQSKNPWTEHPSGDGRTRSRCEPGDLHVHAIRQHGDHPPYHVAGPYAWVWVYHSDEYDSCN